MLFTLLLATVIAPTSPDVPYKQPQAAVNQQSMVVTFGAGNGIYVAVSADRGRSFGKPIKVAEPGVLSLGRHRGPRVALLSNSIVVSAIAGATGRGQDGDLFAWRSTDGGATWSKGVRVNDQSGSAREGLHAMAANGQVVFAVWLDLRSKGMKLFSSVSRDGGATWSKNVPVYESPSGGICECCHPSVAIGEDGAMYVMFRNNLAGSRDLYMTRSTDGGKSFTPAEKLGSGTWKLNACPMDGGGLATTSTGKLLTVWRRDKQVFSASDGRSEEMLGTGKDPSIAVTEKGLYAAWTSDGELRVRTPGRSESAVLGTGAGYPQLVATPDRKVIAVWEQGGSILVQPVD